MSHMTTISDQAAARREAHRQTSGEFGEHNHSAPELSLGTHAWPEDLGKTHFTGQWGEVTVEYGSRTPWGPAQHASREADGIAFVPTDGHGGYKLSTERNAAIPAPFRNRSGWYEEDTERVFVELYHYDALFNRAQDADRDRSETLAAFDQKIRDWYPDAYEKVHKLTLEPGESHLKDERNWGEDNADEYVMVAQQQIEDGLLLVTAERRSTGDRDQFILTREQRDSARDEAASELGASGRFRIPAGTKTQPRPEPKPVIAGFTEVPAVEGLTPAAAKKVREELAQRWRLEDGRVMTMAERIADGQFTGKCVFISDSGTREFYLDNDNTSRIFKVSKALFDAFGAPDKRTAQDRAREEWQIAQAKHEKAQRVIDGAWRATPAQYETLRQTGRAVGEAYARYKGTAE